MAHMQPYTVVNLSLFRTININTEHLFTKLTVVLGSSYHGTSSDGDLAIVWIEAGSVVLDPVDAFR